MRGGIRKYAGMEKRKGRREEGITNDAVELVKNCEGGEVGCERRVDDETVTCYTGVS